MGVATGSLVALLFRLVETVLWGFMGVLTARALSVEDRGVYATAIIVASAAGSISSLAAATGYFVSNRQRSPAEVAANALYMAFPVALLVVVAGLGVLTFTGPGNGQVVALAVLALAPAVLRNSVMGVILGSNSIIKYNLAGDVTLILASTFLTGWVLLLDHRTAEGALQAWCAAQYISLLPFVVWGRSWLAWMVSHRPDRQLMLSLVRFAAVTGVGSVIGLLNYRVDQVLVLRLDGEHGAGIYSSAIAVAEGLWLFSASITLASFARVGRGAREEAASLTATGIRHTVLVVIGGGVSAAIVGPWLVQFLFGTAYEGATEPLRILCVGTALFAPQGLINLYFVNQLGRPRFPVLIGCFAFAVSIVAGLVLIPRFGTSGAAWATTLSYGSATMIAVAIFLRRTGLPASELWRIRVSDITAYLRLARQVVSEGVRILRSAYALVAPGQP